MGHLTEKAVERAVNEVTALLTGLREGRYEIVANKSTYETTYSIREK